MLCVYYDRFSFKVNLISLFKLFFISPQKKKITGYRYSLTGYSPSCVCPTIRKLTRTSFTSFLATSKAMKARKNLFLFSRPQLSAWTYNVGVSRLSRDVSIRALRTQLSVRLESCGYWLMSTIDNVAFPWTMVPVMCVCSRWALAHSCNGVHALTSQYTFKFYILQ